MATLALNTEDRLATIFCDIAEKVKNGQVVITCITTSADFYEGLGIEISCRMIGPLFAISNLSAETSAPVPASVILTIDSREYPVADSEVCLSEYIQRVLKEMGHTGTYESYEMQTRPDQSFALTVTGVA